MDDRATVHARREPGSGLSRMAFARHPGSDPSPRHSRFCATACARGLTPPAPYRVDTCEAGPESAPQRRPTGRARVRQLEGRTAHRHRALRAHNPPRPAPPMPLDKRRQLSRRERPHEVLLLPPDAVDRAHRGAAAMAGEQCRLRPRARQAALRQLHRHDGVRGGVRLRLGGVQRAPLQPIRPDGQPQPDRRHPGPADQDHPAGHAGQPHPAPQPDPGGGGVCHAGRALRRTPDRRHDPRRAARVHRLQRRA